MPVRMLPEAPADGRMEELNRVLRLGESGKCHICGADCRQKFCTDCRPVAQRERSVEWCKTEKGKAYMRAWRAAHKAKVSEYNQRWKRKFRQTVGLEERREKARCQAAGCHQWAHVKGMCVRHYYQEWQKQKRLDSAVARKGQNA